MNVVFLGFSRLWFEYLSLLLPASVEGRHLTSAEALSELPAESIAFVDQVDRIGPHSQKHLMAAKRILRLHRPGAVLAETIGPADRAQSNTMIVSLDNSLVPELETDFKHLPLLCGVSTEGPFRTRKFVANEPVVVGVLREADGTISLSDLPGQPELASKLIEINHETSLQSLIADIEQCDIVVEAITQGCYPGLASWLALAQGRAVICNLSALKKRTLAASERLLPIIDSTGENLTSTIDSLVRDPRTLRDLSRRGIDFIKSYRRLERSKAQMARIIESD